MKRAGCVRLPCLASYPASTEVSSVELHNAVGAQDVAAYGNDREGLDLAPPGSGYELYRHKNAQGTKTKGWHGLFWARRTEKGDYEIRSVPSSLGEYSVPEGVMPGEGFEEHYEKVDPYEI